MPTEMYYSQALNLAMDEELARDPDVFLLGEDIGPYGGAFGVTRGLHEKYGARRVRETPISENSFVGLAVGAAMLGLRPVVEIMFMDFVGLAVDQLLNSAGKLHYMYAGQVRVPLVLRTPGGAKGGYGPSHSQMLSGLLAGIPGLKVVAPATPRQARGLLKAAIRDDNPVMFIENKRLYPTRGLVPDGDEVLPLDRCEVVSAGEQATLFCYSAMVPLCLRVKEALRTEGYDVEVVDLVSLRPLDRAGILASVRKTGRAMIVEEACLTGGGISGEVSALLAEQALEYLEAPVLRVGAADVPVPAAVELEKLVLPQMAQIQAAARRLLQF